MINVKKQILETVNTFPDNITWEDALYTLYVNAKIKKSTEDIQNGKVISLDDFDKEMEVLYESKTLLWSEKRYNWK